MNEIKKHELTYSQERLLSFAYSANDTIENITANYKKNIQISQAIYPELCTLEVILRNAIDNLLNVSDYKASYNVFYLLSNAIKNTDVVIQGFNLDHYAIKYGTTADFVSFYNEEIKVREMFNYPPYYEIGRASCREYLVQYLIITS